METPAPPTAAGEVPSGWGLQRVGVLLLVLASLLPYHGCIAHPSEFEDPAGSEGGYSRDALPFRPAAAVEFFVRRDVLGDRELKQDGTFLFPGEWTSNDYGYVPFFGLPPWILALALSRRGGSRARWATGLVLWGITACLPVAIGIAWAEGVQGVGPRGLRDLEAVGAGVAAALVFAARPGGRRRPEDVEATLSTHAVVALGVAFTRPAIDVFRWTFEDGHSGGAILLALVHNYRPGFYVTVAALGLVAAPLYFSGEALRPLYDRLRPWRPRSSTPTPTSTSTASTGTASRSSNGPAPRGSSPS